MSLVSPLLLLLCETRRNGQNKLLLINTYIPVISYTKLNFVTYVGLSWHSLFLICILYQLISPKSRCILSVIPTSWLSAQSLSIGLDPHVVKSLKLMFEASPHIEEYKCANIRYFPITTTRPLQFRFSYNIGVFLLMNHRIFSESRFWILVVYLQQHFCCFGCFYFGLEGNPAKS